MTRFSIESAASDWIARRDAGLTASEQVEFEHWLSDQRHAKALARHQQAWEIFSRPHATGNGLAMAREVHRRVTRRRQWTVVAVAAAFIFLLTGVALRPFVARESGKRAALTKAHLVRYEQQALPDGSIIELRPGAEISVNLSDKYRRVELLKGEAVFRVAKDKNRPFIVSVHKVAVRAVGTEFLVQRGEARVEVLVTEGKVSVDCATMDSSVGAQSVLGGPIASTLTIATVGAGQRALVDLSKGTPVARIEVMDPAAISDRLDWRTPRLEFTATPLADAVASLNKYNVVQLTVDDPSIAALEVSGYFRANNVNAFLHLIEQSLGVRGERKGDTIILRKAP